MPATTMIQARLDRHKWRTKEFRRQLLRWYRREGRTFPWRISSASHYVLIVSEVLLQRTRAEAVAAFFPGFIKQFPGWNQLADASEEELCDILKPIGLWRRRATSLRAFSKEIRKRRGRFPRVREEIEALPGVGQYVANAILLFCHDGREALLDVNMARVLERCFAPRKLADIRYDPWLQAVARSVVDHPKAREINWAILDVAAAICHNRKPRCEECPLRTCCSFSNRSNSHRQNGTGVRKQEHSPAG